jgi:hypothetical protein
MSCDRCRESRPTAYVELRYNVGALVMRQEYATRGELCRGCLHRVFADYTLRNVTLGWWGIISFFMTWYFLAANLADYTRALSELRHERAPKAGATPRAAAAGAEADARLAVFEHNVRVRLRSGQAPADIGHDLAGLHDVGLEDAMRFVERVRLAG